MAMKSPTTQRLFVGLVLTLLLGSAQAACILSPLSSVVPVGESVELKTTCEDGSAADLFDKIDWRKDGLTVVGGFRNVIATTPTTSRVYQYRTPANLPAGNYVYRMIGRKGETDTPIGDAQLMVVAAPGAAGPKLTVYLSNPQGGSVAIGAPVSATCQSTGRCDYTPSLNAALTLTPSAATGYTFAGWSGACTGTGVCQVKMLSDKTATATFNATGTTPGVETPGCGTAHLTEVTQQPTGTAACKVGEPYLMWTSESRYTWNCPGTGSGSYYCIATRPKGAPGECGSAAIEKGSTTINTAAPTSNLCVSTAATPTVSIGTDANAKYTWTCTGANTPPTNAACTAKHGYTVQASVSGGTVNASSKVVEHGTTTSFTYTPTSGYTGTISGCGGTTRTGVSTATAYTTGTISGACTVTGSFSSVQNPSTDPGYGEGFWIPPGYVESPLNNSTLVVADHSGSPPHPLMSFLPGCLNGSLDASGCSANSSFTATPAGLTGTYTFQFDPSKTLSLRYKPNVGAGSTNKSIALRSSDGNTNLAAVVEMWITTDPTVSYANASLSCKISTNRDLYVVTGPSGCPISDAQPIYYLNIRQTISGSYRYQLDTSTDDFQ